MYLPLKLQNQFSVHVQFSRFRARFETKMNISFVSALSSVRLRNRKVVTYSQERNVKWPVGPVPRLYSEREFLCLIPMAFLTAALDDVIFVG